ncbi:MAG: hypothetical protein R3C15_13935 [Thermoleophilia bacterium]
MKRGIRNVGIAAGAAALSLSLVGGALASSGHESSNGKRKGKRIAKLEGRLAAAPAGSVTVQKRNGKSLTCAVGAATIADWAVAGAQARLTCSNSPSGKVVRSLDPIGKSVRRADAFEAEGRGTVSALTDPTATADGSITVTSGSSQLVCVIPMGTTLPAGLAVDDLVEVTCVLSNNVWTLTRIHEEDSLSPGREDDDDRRGSHDGLEVKGAISALTQPTATEAGSITIGTAPSAVTCVIPAGSTLATAFQVGSTVEVKCSTDGTQWTLTRIHAEDDVSGAGEVEVKGAISALTAPSATAAGSIAVGSTTCAVPAASTLVAGFAVGQLVEIKCLRDATGLVLVRIHAEDSSDDDDDHRGRGRGSDD